MKFISGCHAWKETTALIPCLVSLLSDRPDHSSFPFGNGTPERQLRGGASGEGQSIETLKLISHVDDGRKTMEEQMLIMGYSNEYFFINSHD
jgi:hypothetical protein